MANNYKPGMVSGLLFASSKSKEGKDATLEKLFSKIKTPSVPPKEILKPSTLNVNTVINKKKESVTPSKAGDKLNTSAPTEPFPYIHETLLPKIEGETKVKKGVKRKLEKKDADKDEHELKRPRRNRKRDKHADNRTVFVGNCPLSADKKTLKKVFREFGEIETIRFRCAPPADPNLPRRAIVITKNFHEQGNNIIAYIVFREEEAAKKALIRNGYLLDNLHLRVDIASLSKKHDKKRSVFVGNLPFTITEEAIRSHFEDCGDITNVRIVRDRLTSLGKGICYIQFESKDSVSLALKLNNTELQGRQLRVSVCSNKVKKQGQKESDKSKSVKESSRPKQQKISFCPSNKSKESFKELMKAKKEKRFRKIKKKKESAQKADNLSSIFGSTAPADYIPLDGNEHQGEKTKRRKTKKKSIGLAKRYFQK